MGFLTAVGHALSRHPLRGKRPDVFGIKFVECDAISNAIEGYKGRYVIALDDGRIFERPETDFVEQWKEVKPYREFGKLFNSEYFEQIVDDAEKKGLEPVKSAYTLYMGRMTKRAEVKMYGTDKDIENIDILYPDTYDPSEDYIFSSD